MKKNLQAASREDARSMLLQQPTNTSRRTAVRPAMSNFAERIQQKAADAAQAPVVIVAFGDSVTQGVMEYARFDFKRVYHRQLQEKLEHACPGTTFSTINAGVDGSSATQALGRLSRDVIRHQPDLVTVAFGLNDSLGGIEGLPAFERALHQIVATIRDETNADIVLLTPPFMATRLSNRIHPRHIEYADIIIRSQNDGMLERYADVIRQTAHQNAIALADVHAEWAAMRAAGIDTDAYLCNGLNHPNAEGHRLAADIVFNAVLSSLGRG